MVYTQLLPEATLCAAVVPEPFPPSLPPGLKVECLVLVFLFPSWYQDLLWTAMLKLTLQALWSLGVLGPSEILLWPGSGPGKAASRLQGPGEKVLLV